MPCGSSYDSVAKLIRVSAVQVHDLVQNDGGDESARASRDLTYDVIRASIFIMVGEEFFDEAVFPAFLYTQVGSGKADMFGRPIVCFC